MLCSQLMRCWRVLSLHANRTFDQGMCCMHFWRKLTITAGGTCPQMRLDKLLRCRRLPVALHQRRRLCRQLQGTHLSRQAVMGYGGY